MAPAIGIDDAEIAAIAEVAVEFAGELSKQKRETTLPGKLVSVTAKALAEAAFEVEGFDFDDYGVLRASANAGWKVEKKVELPDALELVLGRWTGHAVAAAAGSGAKGGPLGEGPTHSARTDKFTKEISARRDLVDVEGLDPALDSRLLERGIEACVKQGLSPGALKCFSISIYLGKATGSNLVESLDPPYVFGSDPKLCKLVQEEVKAKGETFPANRCDSNQTV